MSFRALAIVLVAVALSSLDVGATVPKSITVQGRLTDDVGDPLPVSAKTFRFRIFDSEVGGSKLWPATFEQQSLTPDAEGLWNTQVGAFNSLTDTVFADTVCWLEIEVNGTVLPRVRLVTGPFAYRVATVDGASGGKIDGKLNVGSGNANSGELAFVVGESNVASGAHSSVTGGGFNSAGGDESTVSGGVGNQASGPNSFVGGGVTNTADGNNSVVAGGGTNEAVGTHTAVGGGEGNSAQGDKSSIGGGSFNTTAGLLSVIGGGSNNSAALINATVAGGALNAANGATATVGGGISDTASGTSSTVSGGSMNVASGDYATIPGGAENVAAGNHSFAAGRFANAMHNGAFVWADRSESADFSSSATNQFLIRSAGGVGIGETAPAGQLHVTNSGPNNIALYLAGGGRDLAWPSGQPLQLGHWDGADFTERLRVTPVGRLGVGTDVPESRLHVLETSAGSPTALAAAVGVFERMGNAYLQVFTGPTDQSGIYFGDSVDSENGGIVFNSSSTPEGLEFRVEGNTVGMWLDRFGSLTVNGTVNAEDIDVDDGGIHINSSTISIPIEVEQGTFFDPIADDWDTWSSRRWKDSIETIRDPLSKVMRLRGVSYFYKPEGTHTIGLIAEEVGEVIPEIVSYEENGVDARSLDYARLVALLIEGMKEQQREIEVLKKRVDLLTQ